MRCGSSCASNSTHGERRNPDETERVIRLVLQHPKFSKIGNVDIAKHLHVTEATIRRWRKQLSSSRDEDSVRVVTRKGTTYALATGNIGKNKGALRTKTRRDLGPKSPR